MSRDNLSSAATRAMFDQQTGDGFLCKIMFDHPDWPVPMRFIDDQVPAVGGVQKRTDAAADDWLCFPFKITLPDDRDDEIGLAQLSIDNVDRQIVQTIRSISTPPTVSVWICLLSDIDDIIAGPFDFAFNAAQWTALTVSGNLEYEPILNMRWPADDFTPLTTPGLFKQ